MDASSTTPSTTLKFPSDVYKWMKKNAASRNARILMSLSKYFQDIKLSIIKIKDITPRSDGEWAYKNLNEEYQIINYQKLPKNLLLTERIWFDRCQLNQLLNNVWGCNLKEIHSTNHIMTYDDFLFLTSGGTVEQFIIMNTKINFNNSTPVPLDRILKCLPNVIKVYIDGNIHLHDFTGDFTLPKLKELTLWKISVNFNIEEFSNFMTVNQKVKYYLVFGHKLNQEYIQKIQTSFDKIVETWLTRNNPPQIIFPCQTEQSKKAMRKLRKRYLSRILRNV